MAAPEDGEDKKGMDKQGLPPGHHFVPEDLELLDILEHKLRSSPLPRSLDAVFHEVGILDFHPAKLYEMYAKDEEDGYIYFFSTREFPGRKKMRPQRAAPGGRWKVFSYCQTVESDKDDGVPVGCKLTLEFYERRFVGDNKNSVRTNWGMHEFVRIIGPQNEVADLAVYRLYKRNAEEKRKDLAAGAADSRNKSEQALAAAMAPALGLPPSTPSLPPVAQGLPRRMVLMADQANVALTTQAYAPSSQLQQEWHQNACVAVAAPPGAAGPSIRASPRAPGPSNFWPPQSGAVPILWVRPRAQGPIRSWAPPSAPGHYGYVASMDSRQPLVQLPAVAASPLGQKGNAPRTSTEHAGYAWSTYTWAPPAANYQPPPPPQKTVHLLGLGVAVGYEDDCHWQQQGYSPAASVLATVLDAVPRDVEWEWDQMPFGFEESPGAQLDATMPSPSPPPLQDDNGFAAGTAGGGGSLQGGQGSFPSTSAENAAAGLDVPGGDDVSSYSITMEDLFPKGNDDGDVSSSAVAAQPHGGEGSGSHQHDPRID